jgi:hypothetical protein
MPTFWQWRSPRCAGCAGTHGASRRHWHRRRWLISRCLPSTPSRNHAPCYCLQWRIPSAAASSNAQACATNWWPGAAPLCLPQLGGRDCRAVNTRVGPQDLLAPLNYPRATLAPSRCHRSSPFTYENYFGGGFGEPAALPPAACNQLGSCPACRDKQACKLGLLPTVLPTRLPASPHLTSCHVMSFHLTLPLLQSQMRIECAYSPSSLLETAPPAAAAKTSWQPCDCRRSACLKTPMQRHSSPCQTTPSARGPVRCVCTLAVGGNSSRLGICSGSSSQRQLQPRQPMQSGGAAATHAHAAQAVHVAAGGRYFAGHVALL